MNCPKCRKDSLQPTGTPLGVSTVHHCSECQGLWFAMADWDALEAAGKQASEVPLDTEADEKEGLCPAGHGFLSREQVRDAGFSLDRCGLCGGTWFDRGEWEKLSSDGLLGVLDDLWTPSPQRMERLAVLSKAVRPQLAVRFGQETLQKLDELAALLLEHPHRAAALSYLADKLK